jgi:hypothetical protein
VKITSLSQPCGDFEQGQPIELEALAMPRDHRVDDLGPDSGEQHPYKLIQG